MRLLLTFLIFTFSINLVTGKERSLSVDNNPILIYSEPSKKAQVIDILKFFNWFTILDYLNGGWVAIEVTHPSERKAMKTRPQYIHRSDYLHNTSEMNYESPDLFTYRLAKSVREEILKLEYKTGIDLEKNIPIAVVVLFIALVVAFILTKNTPITRILSLSVILITISLLEIIYIPVMRYDFWFYGIDRWGWVQSLFRWLFCATLLLLQFVFTMKTLLCIKTVNEDRLNIFLAFKGVYLLVLGGTLYGFFTQAERTTSEITLIGVFLFLIIQALTSFFQLIKLPKISIIAALFIVISTFGLMCFSTGLLSIVVFLLWPFTFIPLSIFSSEGLDEWSKKIEKEKKEAEERRQRNAPLLGDDPVEYGSYKPVTNDRRKYLEHQNRHNSNYKAPTIEKEKLIGQGSSCYYYNVLDGNCRITNNYCRANLEACDFRNMSETEIENEIDKRN